MVRDAGFSFMVMINNSPVRRYKTLRVGQFRLAGMAPWESFGQH